MTGISELEETGTFRIATGHKTALGKQTWFVEWWHQGQWTRPGIQLTYPFAEAAGRDAYRLVEYLQFRRAADHQYGLEAEHDGSAG